MNQNDSNLKYCTDCKTTKTPLWRGGPAGPKVKSLLSMIMITIIIFLLVLMHLCFNFQSKKVQFFHPGFVILILGLVIPLFLKKKNFTNGFTLLIFFLGGVFQSLCNACGIRFRKKKRVFEGLKKRSDKKKDKTTNAAAAAASASAKVVAEKADGTGNASCCVNGLGDSFKMRLMALGQEVLLQRSSPSTTSKSSPSTTSKSSPSLFLPSVVAKKQRCQRKRKLKEEEQAAFSLMALSCGFVFA